jgi:hypothetical protein
MVIDKTDKNTQNATIFLVVLAISDFFQEFFIIFIQEISKFAKFDA